MIRLEFSAFHRPLQPERLTAFLFILRSWSPTHSNINFFVLDFYERKQLISQPNISKNLFTNIQKKYLTNKFKPKKSLTSHPRKNDEWVLRSIL